MDLISERAEPLRAQAATDGTARNATGEAELTQAIRWRPPVLANAPQVHQSRNPSLPTFVGLMMLILTFFIVLTSISLHDKTKSDKAIASVQAAFGNAVSDEELAIESDDDIARAYIAGLTRRIQSLMPLIGGRKGPVSDHQVLWLPAELAFPGNGAVLAPAFPTVLREIIHSLEGVPQRLTPRIEMRLCANEPSDQLRTRATAIGAALARERAPLTHFSIGIAPCDPDHIGIAVALAPAAEGSASAAEEQAQ